MICFSPAWTSFQEKSIAINDGASYIEYVRPGSLQGEGLALRLLRPAGRGMRALPEGGGGSPADSRKKPIDKHGKNG